MVDGGRTLYQPSPFQRIHPPRALLDGILILLPLFDQPQQGLHCRAEAEWTGPDLVMGPDRQRQDPGRVVLLSQQTLLNSSPELAGKTDIFQF